MQLVVPFGAKGKERRRLADEVGRAAGKLPRYMKYPTCNYLIGEFTLDRDGNLIIPDTIAENQAKLVMSHLRSVGFDALGIEVPERLSVSVPADTLSEAEQQRLVEFVDARQQVLRAGLRLDDVVVEHEGGKLVFAWFPYTGSPEDVAAYQVFIEQLLALVRSLKRVVYVDSRVSNDRYAWRCFLLRLGMIGPEFRAARAVLMRGVPGSSAYSDIAYQHAG